jgi:hypothetical protein
MASSTLFVILDTTEDKNTEGKKKVTSPKVLDVSSVRLEHEGEPLKSPKASIGSPRSGSPRGVIKSPRLVEALRAPSPPREEEFKDAQAHEQAMRRKSSGNFDLPKRKNSGGIGMIKVVRVKSEGEPAKEETFATKDSPGTAYKKM